MGLKQPVEKWHSTGYLFGILYQRQGSTEESSMCLSKESSEFTIDPVTLGWISARLKREWPYVPVRFRQAVCQKEPEWVSLAEVHMEDPYLGLPPEDLDIETTSSKDIPIIVLAGSVARLRRDWPTMTRRERERQATVRPEVFEASGVRMDAPVIQKEEGLTEEEILRRFEKELDENPEFWELPPKGG